MTACLLTSFVLWILMSLQPVVQQTDRHQTKLLPPPGDQIYFAAYPDFGGDETDITAQRITSFEALAGKDITWACFSQLWFESMAYPYDQVHTIHDTGVIPYIRMQPRSTRDEYVRETVYTMDNIIAGQFDAELRQWARDAKADGIPLCVEFCVEVNGQWFPWNGFWNGGGTTTGYGDPTYPDGPERYRDAYRHVIDLFRSEHVSNITWFFHTTSYAEPDEAWNDPKYYYPGDDYIDWIGVSVYGALYPAQNYWDTFDETLTDNNAVQKLLEISNTKPFALLEFGVTDFHPLGSKPQWLTEAFDSILTDRYIHFSAINYWHENWDNNGSMTTLRIDSSPASLTTFQNLISNPRFISQGRFTYRYPHMPHKLQWK